MISTIDPEQGFHITGDTQSVIDDDLTAAVTLAQEHAREQGRGILVTRIGPGSYTVMPSFGVPYGVIEERDG